MKHSFLMAFVFGCFTFLANAQILQGEYRNGDEYMKFKGESVAYYFKLGCCLVNEYKGVGKWSIKDNKLRIAPVNNEQTSISTTPSINKDSLYINIEVDDTSLFLLPSITFYNTKNRFGVATSGRQVAISKNTIKGGDSLSIMLYGYLSANCKLNPSLDYSVKLSKGNDLSYLEPILKLSNGGLPVKMKDDKIVIKRLTNIGHTEYKKWVKYLKE